MRLYLQTLASCYPGIFLSSIKVSLYTALAALARHLVLSQSAATSPGPLISSNSNSSMQNCSSGWSTCCFTARAFEDVCPHCVLANRCRDNYTQNMMGQVCTRLIHRGVHTHSINKILATHLAFSIPTPCKNKMESRSTYITSVVMSRVHPLFESLHTGSVPYKLPSNLLFTFIRMYQILHGIKEV